MEKMQSNHDQGHMCWGNRTQAESSTQGEPRETSGLNVCGTSVSGHLAPSYLGSSSHQVPPRSPGSRNSGRSHPG